MSSFIVCVAFALTASGQTGPVSDKVASPERQKALLEQIHRGSATPSAKAKVAAEKARISASHKAAHDRAIAEKPARDAARAATIERARKEFDQNAKLQAQAQEEYRKALPFLLENQRQQLDRLSAFERNMAVNRIAGSNQAIANAIGMESVRRANARLGYDTPFFTTIGPGVTPYGPYGAVAFPPAQAIPTPTPNPAAIYNNIMPVPQFPYP
jgi:hypothetical protein